MDTRCTFIVPCYNVASTLERCLESLQAQTCPDWDCVCVDDGSTDTTAEIAERFRQTDSRFRLFRKKNGGVASARNLGLEYAAGEFFAFVDADDALQPTFLEACLAVSETADMVIGNILSIEKVRTRCLYTWLGAEMRTPAAILEQFRFQYIVSKLYRKDLLDRHSIQFSTLSLHEDEPFLTQFLLHSENIRTVDSTLYVYDYNVESLTNTLGQRHAKKRCRLRAALEKQTWSALALRKGKLWKDALDRSCLESAMEGLSGIRDAAFRQEALALAHDMAVSVAPLPWWKPRLCGLALLLLAFRWKSWVLFSVARRVCKLMD